jgi:uncharacterized protein YcbK (DUF882 family)
MVFAVASATKNGPRNQKPNKYNLIASASGEFESTDPMLTSQLKELARYKAKVADLESAISNRRKKQLERLHVELGFASRDELIAALRSVGRNGSAKRGRRAGGKSKTRHKRTTITPELRSKIEAAVRAGGKGLEVAEKFDVSLPTVQNIKRAAGLTRKTKRK